MVRAATALLAGLALALGLAACGGGNSDVSDVVPKTTPDLVAPKDTSLPEVTAASTTPTNPTTSTPAASDTAGTSGTAGTTTTGGTTGGTGAVTTSTTPAGTNTNGSQAGGLSPFCDSNPDAC